MNCLDRSLPTDVADTDGEHHGAASTWLEAHRDEPLFAPTFVLDEVLRDVARVLGPAAVEEGRLPRGDPGWIRR